MNRRLLAVPLAVLGLLLGAGSALAAGPTAIGTDSDGISYVGYATGGGIQRFAAADGSTAALPSWGTAGTGAGQLGGIVAIGVGAGQNGHVYVLDTNLRVQEFTKAGNYVRGTQLPACDTGVAPDPAHYGGLDVRASNSDDAPTAIYVAHPCKNQLLKLSPVDLSVAQTTTTPSRPGRVAAERYDTAPATTQAVFVALPSQKKVTSYKLTDLSASTAANATRNYTYTPTDLFVDAYGVLFVGDAENGKIHQYGDAAKGDADDPNAEFRYIGGQGMDVGRLSDPEAFDVFGQNGGDLAGNVFIADSGNSRIQRMNSYGYTYWASAATGSNGGPVVQVPVNTAAPAISGTATVGQQLSCSQGTWSNTPTAYAYTWRRGGTDIPGATSSQYTLVAADQGQSITCRVTATNAAGSTAASSPAVTPGPAPVQAPVNSTAPSISGGTTVGQQVSCAPGTWSGSPTYTYSWRRDGSEVATGSTYTLVAADSGKAITCVVTATNAGGSPTATSPAITPTTPVQAPASTGAPSIQGTAAEGQQLTCTQGSWSNGPTSYAYSWRRDGGEIATGAQYTLVAADAGHAITCVVTASNSGGSATSTSGAVYPTAAPPAVQAPVNAARPGIQGTAVVGNTLTCVNGTWTNSPTGYAFAWKRDGTAIAGATGSTYALVAADAGKSVSCVVTATNAGGSAAAESDAVAISAAPTSTPTRVGVTINAGAEATNSASVTLTIRPPALATAVVISNDGSFDTPTQLPISAGGTYPWKLDARGSQRRARVVYVRFVAVGTDANQTFSDDILLDTTAPTVSAATVSSRLKTASAVVNVKASDSGSGVKTIEYASTKSAAKAVSVPARKAKSFRAKKGTGAKVRWVRAIDVAGNRSKWKAVTLKAPRKKAAKKH